MEETIKLIGITSVVCPFVFAIIYFIGRNYLTEKIKNSVKNEYDKDLENHKSQLTKEIEKLKYELSRINLQKEVKWTLKREACFEALQLADNLLSNIPWENIPKDGFIKAEVSTIEARKTYNKLATSCDFDIVLKLMKSIITGKDENGNNINLGIIVDLRNAVRKELGFGGELDNDKNNAFFGRLYGDN